MLIYMGSGEAVGDDCGRKTKYDHMYSRLDLNLDTIS